MHSGHALCLSLASFSDLQSACSLALNFAASLAVRQNPPCNSGPNTAIGFSSSTSISHFFLSTFTTLNLFAMLFFVSSWVITRPLKLSQPHKRLLSKKIFASVFNVFGSGSMIIDLLFIFFQFFLGFFIFFKSIFYFYS